MNMTVFLITTLSQAPIASAEASTFELRLAEALTTENVVEIGRLRDELLEAQTKAPALSSADHYLRGYLNWRLSHGLEGIPARREEKKTLLNQAQKALEASLEAEPQNAEASALLASVLGEQIGESIFKAMQLGPKVGQLFNQAIKLAPDNPRVRLLRGISHFYTPSTFGGGKTKAMKELDKAQALFDAQPSSAPWPNWGRLDTFAWRGQILAQMKQTEKARAVYEKALAAFPNAAWIRDRLLPALPN